MRSCGSAASPTRRSSRVPAASQYHYRNKLEYSFTQTDEGPALGFHRAGRWDEVLPIDVRLLTTDIGNAVRDAVQAWAREEKLLAYDQTAHTGYLRHLVVREGRNTGQLLVQLVTAAGRKFEEDSYFEVHCRFPGQSVHWAVTHARGGQQQHPERRPTEARCLPGSRSTRCRRDQATIRRSPA